MKKFYIVYLLALGFCIAGNSATGQSGAVGYAWEFMNPPKINGVTLTGAGDITIPSNDIYFNSATTTSGVAVFYLTSDKTLSGTALFTTVPLILPIINDAANNYTYGWVLSGDKKTLTVTAKVSTQNVVALVGLTLLGVPGNVTNGTTVAVCVKGY